jgi:cold-inducible RNA-binding protein
MKISFSNFPQNLSETDIEKIFQEFGAVQKLALKRDKITKKSMGLGTLEMDDSAGKKSIESLNGKEMEDKKLSVGDLEELQAKVQAGKSGAKTSGYKSGGKMFGNTSGGGGSVGILRRGGNRGS